MKRREFITLFGGAATWSLAARAQQGERIRRIGALLAVAESDPEAKLRATAFEQALQVLGWVAGRNVQIEFRYGGGDASRTSAYAVELVTMGVDVLLANSSPALAALQRQTKTIPIVFVQVADPVGAGFIESLARPGGNTTGFTSFEYTMSGKWLELLKEISPNIARVAVLRDPTFAAPAAQLGAIQALAPLLRVPVQPIGVRDAIEIERAITAFSREPDGGLIVLTSPLAVRHRHLIIALAERYRLPAIYAYRYYATAGGLITYGLDNLDLFRSAASYVDLILKGSKPGDLPVQAPTKFQLIINLKAAKAIDLTVPPMLLARADEVIE